MSDPHSENLDDFFADFIFDVEDSEYVDEFEPIEDLAEHGAPVGRNDFCPCGSGKKYKKCCAANQARPNPVDASGAGTTRQLQTPRYPLGTVARYGPDDKTTTKIVVGVIKRAGDAPIVQKFTGAGVSTNPRVKRQTQKFFREHRIRSIASSQGNQGCPHDEGIDYPRGQDCPHCPYWAGKQGSHRRV